MGAETAAARLAAFDDLDFVSQDGYLSQEVVARKIEQEECFLVEVNQEKVGFLRLEYLWSLVPYIALIHVQEGRQNQGYSQVLLDYVVEALREKGHDCLYSSSQADEPAPQAWHRKMGFVECGVINQINEGCIGEIFFKMAL